MKTMHPAKDHFIGLRLDDEDFELLVAVAKLDKLPLSESLRRAVRHFAKALDVQNPAKSA